MNMVLLHSLEKKKNKKACYDEECKLLNAQKSNTRAVMLQDSSEANIKKFRELHEQELTYKRKECLSKKGLRIWRQT